MSKNSFHASFDDETVHEFKNAEEGIAAFAAYAEECGACKKDTAIGVESTGVYHLLFCPLLSAQEWRILVINPLLTTQMIKAGLRMVKMIEKMRE
jgi:transposase